jgi:regulator of sigma D
MNNYERFMLDQLRRFHGNESIDDIFLEQIKHNIVKFNSLESLLPKTDALTYKFVGDTENCYDLIDEKTGHTIEIKTALIREFHEKSISHKRKKLNINRIFGKNADLIVSSYDRGLDQMRHFAVPVGKYDNTKKQLVCEIARLNRGSSDWILPPNGSWILPYEFNSISHAIKYLKLNHILRQLAVQYNISVDLMWKHYLDQEVNKNGIA